MLLKDQGIQNLKDSAKTTDLGVAEAVKELHPGLAVSSPSVSDY
jgi:hypothetical protein